jgi:hypothetical protein
MGKKRLGNSYLLFKGDFTPEISTFSPDVEFTGKIKGIVTLPITVNSIAEFLDQADCTCEAVAIKWAQIVEEGCR